MKNIKCQNYISILLFIGLFYSCDGQKIRENNSDGEKNELQSRIRPIFANHYEYLQSKKEEILDTLNETNVLLSMDISTPHTHYTYWVCENNGTLVSKSIAIDMFAKKISIQPYVQKIPIKKIDIEKLLIKYNFFTLPKFDVSYDSTFIKKYNIALNPTILVKLDVHFAEKNNSILRFGDYKRIDETYSLELFNELFSLLKCPCPFVVDVFHPQSNEGCQEVYYNDFEKDYPMILSKNKWLKGVPPY